MMRRREFISLLGGAATWPLAAPAQPLGMPVIGFLDPRLPETIADRVRAFRQGLRDSGYVEGENVAIEYRWAENHHERLAVRPHERAEIAVVFALRLNNPSTTTSARTA